MEATGASAGVAMRGGEEVVLEGLFANNCPRPGRRGSPENLRVAIVELAIPIGETEVHVTALLLPCGCSYCHAGAGNGDGSGHGNAHGREGKK